MEEVPCGKMRLYCDEIWSRGFSHMVWPDFCVFENGKELDPCLVEAEKVVQRAGLERTRAHQGCCAEPVAPSHEHDSYG